MDVRTVTQHYPMLQRNLLYTGVTHGKRLVVLVGQRKAVAIAVHGVSGRRRWSKLREWLRGGSQQVVDRDIRPNRIRNWHRQLVTALHDIG